MSRNKEKIMRLLEALHRKIFREEMSDAMRDFLRNLSFSFFGGIVAAAIMFGVSIMAGRMLGPSGYGEYNYLLSLATAATTFFLLGNNSGSTRFLSDQNQEKRRGSFASAALAITFVQGLVFFLASILISDYLEVWLGLDQSSILLVFIFAAALAFKELADAFLRGFLHIKNQAVFRVTDALSVFGIFIFLSFNRNSFSSVDYVYAIIFGAVVFISASFIFLRKNFHPFSFLEIKELLNYNKHLLLAAIGGVILGLDKVIIGRTIGTEDLGIFSAYYASSQLIISNLSLIFLNVFWPFAINNKSSIGIILHKLDRLFIKFAPMGIVLNILSVTFFVSLYGKEYELQPHLVFLFSLVSVANIIFFVYVNLLNIDYVSRAALIILAMNVFMVASLAVFQSIPIYLTIQTLTYLGGLYLIRRKLISSIKV